MKPTRREVLKLIGATTAAAAFPNVVLGQDRTASGGEVRWGLRSGITNIDPHILGAQVDRTAMLHCVEQLVAMDEQFGNVVGDLAESWTASEDGRSFTFNLRRGVRFHNGKELSAEDVKASFDRIKRVSVRSSQFEIIEDINILDRHTVEFVLSEPSGIFLRLLANPFGPATIIPAEDADKEENEITHPIGTGPFKFVEWVPNQHIIFERFEDYVPSDQPTSGYGGRKVPELDRIVLIPISESASRVAAFLAGDLDGIEGVPPNDFERLGTNGRVITQVANGLLSPEMRFSLHDDSALADAPQVRSAIAHALDRQAMLDFAQLGYGKVNSSWAFPGTPYYTETQATWHPFDPDRARELLREGGYGGERVTITSTPALPYSRPNAIVAQSQLAAIGMNVEVEEKEWAAVMDNFWNRSGYDWQSQGFSAQPDPYFYYSTLYASSGYVGYDNPEFDSTLQDASRTLGLSERAAKYDRLHQLLLRDVPGIKVYQVAVLDAHWDHVQGYRTWPGDYLRLWNTRVER